MSDREEDVKGDYKRAVSNDPTVEQYDVFILYDSGTKDTALHVDSALKQRSISCIFEVVKEDGNNDTSDGHPVSVYIDKWIAKSKKTLIILGQHSIKYPSLLEALLTHNQTKEIDSRTLRLLLHEVDENDIQYLRRVFLATVPRTKTDFNKNGWEDILVSHINSETKSKRNKIHDVFIVHKSMENEEIACRIEGVLEKRYMKVQTDWKPGALEAGHCKYDSIVKCVHNSDKTLIILTKKSLESPWALLEILQAIEQSQETDILTLRLIVNDVKDEEFKYLRRGILASVPHFRLDFDEDNWQTKLVENITSEVQLPDILPLEGSLAHGLVFSHYVGFLSYVLPILKEKIEDIKIFKDNPRRVSKKYYILLPKTCEVPGSLESCVSGNQIHIEKEEDIQFEKKHAGKLRTFKLAIYKITKKTESGGESFYFFADCPYILNAMFEMKNKGLKEVDMIHQLGQLYHLLDDVINHAENNDCFGTVKLIIYDEKTEVESAIYHAVTESIETEITEDKQDKHEHDKDRSDDVQEKSLTGAVNECSSKSETSVNDGKSSEYDVAINYSAQDSGKVYEVVMKLKTFFESRKVAVYMDKGNERELSIRPGRWQLFVLSPQTVNRPNLLIYRCACVLEQGLRQNVVHVLPVLVDIEPKDLPRYIKWVTVVNASKPRYCKKLFMAMKGGIVRMEHRLPSGDVATGLAWAYVINYLKITLLGEDLRGRVKQFLKEKNIDCGCILKMFPVLTKSCTVEDLKAIANDGVKGNNIVQYMGKLDPVIADTGCQLGRPFYLHVYKLTDVEKQKSVCFIEEFFTPGHCLHEMTYSYPFAGLQVDDMIAQGRRTVKLVQDILHLSAVKQKLGDMSSLVEIVYYDGKEETLTSALYKHILDKKDKHTIVFAEEG